MKRLAGWSRNVMALVGVLALGWWLGSERTVQAAGDPFQFQLTEVTEASSLLVYQPANKTVYVYRGATAGSSNLQCSYKYVLGVPGGSIQRVSCPVQVAP